MSSSSIFDSIPAALPPPGITSNLVNPTTQTTLIIALAVVFASLATIVTLIRLYVRSFLTHSLGWDDYLCALSVMASWIHSSLMINATHIGFGTHLWDIRASTLLQESNVRWLSSISTAYTIAITLVKISILLLYYRVFYINRPLRIVLISSTVCISMVYSVYMSLNIVTTVECVSLNSLLKYSVCQHTYPIQLSSSVFSVVTDLWILLLPIRSLLALQIDKHRKIGLIATFGTGAIAFLLSLARCIYMGLTFQLADTLWTAALVAELTIVELNIAIMVACTPTLPKFYSTVKEFSSSIYHSLLDRTSRLDSSSTKREAPSLDSNEKNRAYRLPTTRQGIEGRYPTRVTVDTKSTDISN